MNDTRTDPDKQRLAERKARFWETTDYDRAFRGSFGRFMTDVEGAALDRVKDPSRAEVWLDLGCGHGRFLAHFAPDAARLIGLDFSDRLLKIAGEKLAAEPLESPTGLLRASAMDIPLEDGTVDVVSCVRVVQHVPDQDQTFGEIARVLKPGGSLLLVQYNWLSPHGLARVIKLPVKAALRRLIRATGREPAFDEPTTWTWWPELRRYMEQAGFSVERETAAWLFPLQYFRSRRSGNAWPGLLQLARAYERLSDARPFRWLGGYLILRCRKR
jgi:ubiquinone/menaquinone biosynthesis C-methylase UbiE